MSIAADEAESKYGDTEPWMNRGSERDAYVAGRTAEPTEAEIEAATTEWDRHGYFHRVDTPIVCMCGARLADEHSYDAHLVHAMLIAARKAVAE